MCTQYFRTYFPLYRFLSKGQNDTTFRDTELHKNCLTKRVAQSYYLFSNNSMKPIKCEVIIDQTILLGFHVFHL